MLGFVLVAVGILHIAAIKPGHGWHDDFASYIAHAQNIAEGQPYADTGYVYNAERWVAGPSSYPPLYPLMLAPVVRVAGVNLWAMKLQLVVILTAWLGLLALLLRRHASAQASIAAVTVVGLTPFTFELTNNILSDLPFAMMFTAAILAMDRALDRRNTSLFLAVGVGTLLYLAYATRAIGAVLVPAMWLFVLIRRRSGRATASIATGTFGVLAAGQMLLLDAGSDYATHLAHVSPKLTLVNLWRYLNSLEGLTANPWFPGLGRALFAVFLVLAAYGFVRRLRAPSIVEIAVPIYIATIAIWPSFQDLRFLVPVVPFLVLYAIDAGETIARRAFPRAILVAGIALIGVSYAGVARAALMAPAIEGPTSPDPQATFAFAASHSDPDDLFVFQRPKAFVLYTGRSAVAHAGYQDDEQMRAFIERTGADFLVDADLDVGYLAGYAARHPDEVTLVFTAGEHHVWRVER